MFNEKDFEGIVIKYLTKTASIKDLYKLSEYLKDDFYKNLFEDFVKVDYLSNYSIQNFKLEEEKQKILKLIKKNKVSRSFFIKSLKYVAVISILFFVGYFFFFSNKEKDLLINKKSYISIKPGTNKAVLTLEDGTNVVLGKKNNYNNSDLSVTGKDIVYKKLDKKATKTIKYHYITVPLGGEFFIVLSDDTKIYVNAGSKLKYPTVFSGNEREVELLYGEAYFEVSSATKNDGKKFIVKTKNQKIEVLGTAFNVSFYKNESSILTTLAEGVVKITNVVNHQQITIKPQQQLRFFLKENSFSVRKVDLINETSWKEGFFKFNNKPLFEIMKTLSRWYNVEVSFDNDQLKKIVFTGVFNRKQNLEDIINTINQTKEASFYFKENKIIVKQYKNNQFND